jgi:hypothetical protein
MYRAELIPCTLHVNTAATTDVPGALTDRCIPSLSASTLDHAATTRRAVRRPFYEYQPDGERRSRQRWPTKPIGGSEPISITDAVAAWRVTGDLATWQAGR